MKNVLDGPITEQERSRWTVNKNPVGVQRLLSEMVIQAIKECSLSVKFNLKTQRDDNAQIRQSAIRWLKNKDRNDITSFPGACIALGIDPDKSRKTIFLNMQNIDK